MLNADITYYRDGQFIAKCRENGETVISPNAEHDLCFALSKTATPDCPIQFWNNGTSSLRYQSFTRAGGFRIALGEDYPCRRAKRAEGPVDFFKNRGPVSPLAGKPKSLVGGVPENLPAPVCGEKCST